MKKSISIVLSILCLIHLEVKSQDKENPWSIGAFGGITQYKGDLGNGFYQSKANSNFIHFGLSGLYRIQSRFDFGTSLAYGKWGYEKEKELAFEAKQLQLNTSIRIRMFENDPYVVNPYAHIGVGAAYLSGNQKPGTDIFFPFGVGAQARLNDRFNIFFQETFAYTDHDTRDGNAKRESDWFLMHSAGVLWSLSAPKDSDGDGVIDRRDTCPDTPKGILVDEKGCPFDKDKDKVADYLDKCPDEPGLPALLGCPDKDGDGIPDNADKCPDVAGNASTGGCPDRDGDSIIDEKDSCPDEFGPAETQGCPDRDQDGIPDKLDECPDLAGTASQNGCPGPIGPDPKELSAIVGKVRFDLNKAILNKNSTTVLDNVKSALEQCSDCKLEIVGHTDNTGERNYNKTLSERRASAVLNQLVKMGVDSKRISISGKGFDQPESDNKSSAGRALNRRVEFLFTR